jgi:hypothetical protein
MLTLTDFLKENNNPSDKLVIVDVQKEFDKFIPQGFVDKLNQYAAKFPHVYQIWDSNKAQEPSYNFPNQKGVYEKKYGTTFSKLLKNIGQNLLAKYPHVEEGTYFRFKDNGSILVRVKNNHDWFYINQSLMDLFQAIKKQKVVLVGGADHECLKDIFEAMEVFQIQPAYNREYVYSAKTSNQHQV